MAFHLWLQRGLDEACLCRIKAHSHLLFVAMWTEIMMVVYLELMKDAQSDFLSAQEHFTSSCFCLV